MPKCKNDPKKSYKGTEPSPKGLGFCAHSEKLGKVRKGLDNNIWKIEVTVKGVKRWVKQKTTTNIKNVKSTPIKNDKKINKIDCSKFVIYEKKEKSFSGSESIKIIKGLEINKGFIYKFIDFNLFEKDEIKIPDNYRKKNINKDIIKKYYCDPNKKVLTKHNEEYKIIKEKHKNQKTYFTHFNGERPYLVYIKNDKISIYKIPNDLYYINNNKLSKKDNENKWMYIKFVKEYNCKKIFIGKSPKIKMTLLSGGHGKDFDGNSILLNTKDNEYVFIQTSIIKFTTSDTINEFYSPVGYNDVPYPVGIGNLNTYLFEELEYVPNNKFKKFNKKVKQNAYSYYYGTLGNEKLNIYSKRFNHIHFIDKSQDN